MEKVNANSSPQEIGQKILIESLKWRSRRSMLELDLYFDSFIQNDGLQQLSSGELLIYDEILNLKDEELLLLFQGKTRFIDENLQDVLERILVFPVSKTVH